MAWHTINEAVKLTGRSRRSIYRDMDRGLISYGLDHSGNRQFETSELMRAYGALAPLAQVDTTILAQVGTDQSLDLVLQELQELRKEIQELRATILLIEHKPTSISDVKYSEPETAKKTATWASLFDAFEE